MPGAPDELVIKIKNGDQTAFRQLIEAHRQYAFSLAFRLLCDEEEAKDAVQEGFIKIWKNIMLYDSGKKFTTWMNRIFLNCAIDRFRAIKRKKEVRLEQVRVTLENIFEDPGGSALANKEIAQLIRVIAGDLPEKQRLVFTLRDIEEMKSSEVEEILSLSPTSVKSNLYHARHAIRRKLQMIISTERRLV